MFVRGLLIGLMLFTSRSLCAARGGVVINEIFYHAPDEIQDLEYIELFNPAGQPVDLSGWKLTKGLDYQFPPGTQIAADGYLVLARDAERFKEQYGFAPAGTFKGHLSHKGAHIELLNRRGKKVDSVRYKDE